jgi:hypothetical protein
MTIEEFFDWHGDGSARKFQLIDGEPQAMVPASITHGIIQANVAGLVRNHLLGTGCYIVVGPGIIPQIRSAANFRIPDLAISCERDDHGPRALAEARLIVEILSPSDESETRESVRAYATLPSVREILLIRSTPESGPSFCAGKGTRLGRQTLKSSRQIRCCRWTASSSHALWRHFLRERTSSRPPVASSQRRSSIPPRSRPPNR